MQPHKPAHLRAGENMKKHAKRLLIIGTIFFVTLVGGIVLAISRIPTSADHARVESLLRDVESNYDFKRMRQDGHGPAVYVTGLSYSDHLSVYGVYSEQEVTEILRVVSEAQSKRVDKKTIYVEFCAVELDRRTLYRKATVRK